MLRSITPRRRARSVCLGVLVLATMLPIGSCAQVDQRQEAIRFCAMMPDSVGLYVGNPVTHQGFPIGKVTAITPALADVRIDFTVTERHATIPKDVKAVTRSTSILADRALELVGDFAASPTMAAGECVPLSQSSTPKSLSEVIGSATKLLNSVTPEDSHNLAGVVSGLDEAMRNNGAGINQLMSTSSRVLDTPDRAIGDIDSIIANLGELTSTFDELRGPMKQALLDADKTTADLALTVTGSNQIFVGIIPLISLVGDLEAELGHETQETLDHLEVAIRKASAHATLFASLLKPAPRIINWLVNHANNKVLNTIRWRPPLYRIPTQVNGLVVCGAMNASMPGSCADVAGVPYAVDAALLQYVLSEANRR